MGTWGGAGAGVIVADTVVHVHIGCTFGDLPGRIALDANSRFTRDGSYVLRAFPVLIGPTLPAQFSGVVEGNRLTIVVAVNDTTSGRVVALGPVTVTLGSEPQLGPCPICTGPGMRQMARPAAPAGLFASAAGRTISLRSAFVAERGRTLPGQRHRGVIASDAAGVQGVLKSRISK